MFELRILRHAAVALAIAIAALATTPAAAAPALDDFGFLQTGTVRVVATYRRLDVDGTGWVALPADPNNANNAVIVTAAHNVRDADRVSVIEANSTVPLEANIRAIDDDRDIAFLEVRGLTNGGVPLRVTPVVPPPGQELRTTGYAVASDIPSRGLRAEISGVLLGAYSRTIPNPVPIWRYADVGVAQFQHSINLSPGLSGGPVIDRCGRVVGLNLSNGGGRLPIALNLSPGVNFALSSSEIIKAAEDHGIRLAPDTSPCAEAVAPTTPANPDTNVVDNDVVQTGPPLMERLTAFFGSRPGLAMIFALLAVVAIGIGLWLLFGRSGDRSPQPAPIVDPDIPVVGPTGPEPPGNGDPVQALTLAGRGPGGEAISLRFAAEELRERGRTVGTEGQAHVPDNRPKTLVSRLHAEISFDGKHFYIQDLKSLNKTKVDGQTLTPLERKRLRDGAGITLADVSLTAQID